MDDNVIGKRIRALRDQHGWTQKELAEMAGISPGKLGHCETGTRNVSLETAAKIARALDVSIDDLIPSMADPEKQVA